MSNSKILLNFIPITPKPFTCNVFSKRIEGNVNEPRPFDKAYRTYFINDKGEKEYYWLTTTPEVGFTTFSFDSKENPHAALWLLRISVVNAMRGKLPEKYVIAEKKGHFYTFDVHIKEHTEGWQGVRCEIVWQRAFQQHGLLVDFQFFKKEGIPFSHHVQQLSLSLDNQGLSNRNYYRDK